MHGQACFPFKNTITINFKILNQLPLQDMIYETHILYSFEALIGNMLHFGHWSVPRNICKCGNKQDFKLW